jgi:hypothetical protein
VSAKGTTYKKGVKTGGRKKGTQNKITQLLNKGLTQEQLASDKVAAWSVLSAIRDGNLSCSTCHATGRTTVCLENGETTTRVCQSCGGDLRERVSAKDRGWAADQQLKRLMAELKAVEHSGTTGTIDYASLTPEQWAQIDRAETVLGDLLKE